MQTEITTIVLLAAGATGAFVKEILQDNALELPHVIDGKICLGFLGAVLIGATAGFLIDGSFLTAFLAGYSGYSILEKLTKKKIKTEGQ